jgi:hypothetical protein
MLSGTRTAKAPKKVQFNLIFPPASFTNFTILLAQHSFFKQPKLWKEPYCSKESENISKCSQDLKKEKRSRKTPHTTILTEILQVFRAILWLKMVL